jgi:hypothetical protein
MSECLPPWVLSSTCVSWGKDKLSTYIHSRIRQVGNNRGPICQVDSYRHCAPPVTCTRFLSRRGPFRPVRVEDAESSTFRPQHLVSARHRLNTASLPIINTEYLTPLTGHYIPLPLIITRVPFFGNRVPLTFLLFNPSAKQCLVICTG